LHVSLLDLLLSRDFTPRGAGYGWAPEILLLQVGSDAVIAAAFLAIALVLLYVVRRQRDVPFRRVFFTCGVCLFLAATTQLVGVSTTWYGFYGLEAIAKAATAAVSVVTAAWLVPLIPRVLALPGLQKTVAELTRTTAELRRTNHELERFNRAALGREERIIELKREINALACRLDTEPPYQAV
jgi:hypothetical protein